MKTLLALALLSSAPGCALLIKGTVAPTEVETITHPKPQAPRPTAVELPHVPPRGPGQGTLIIHVPNRETSVHMVTSTTTAHSWTGYGRVDNSVFLCGDTPCAVTLPARWVSLSLQSPATNEWPAHRHDAYVEILPNQTRMLTHTMERSRVETLEEGQPAKRVAASLTLELIGWPLLLTGGIIASEGEEVQAASLSAAVGAALALTGFILYEAPVPTRQRIEKWPSATTLSDYPPN